MALKLKMDSEGHAVLKEGKPVYIDDTDDKELVFDPESLMSKISTLNSESKTHRLKAKELEDRLALFGDAEPEDVEAFLETLEDLGGPEGIEALKKKGAVDVEAIKKQIVEAYEGKLSEKDKALLEKDGTIYKLMVSSQFGTSKFASEKLILPPDIAEATFGKHFKIEDGKVVAYLGEDKILSRENPGEPANFDEALSVIVDKYPMKDRILKGTQASGSGKQNDAGGPAMGGFTPGAMDHMSPVARITAARAAGQKT